MIFIEWRINFNKADIVSSISQTNQKSFVDCHWLFLLLIFPDVKIMLAVSVLIDFVDSDEALT